MIRYRFRTKLASSLAATALLVGLVAAPTSLAATANVLLNGGTTTTPPLERAATPLEVSPGKVAGFYIAVKNADTSNLPTFFMTASSLAAPYGAYWYPAGTTDYHACTTSPLRCDFGTFSAGSEAVVVAAFTVPTSAGDLSSTKNCKPSSPTDKQRGFALSDTTEVEQTWACVDFKFASSQGNVPGKNQSRGDEFHWYDFVSADVDPKNEAAQFPYCDLSVTPGDNSDCPQGLLSLNNSLSLSNSPNRLNIQYTKVDVSDSGAFDSDHGTSGIHVADGGSFTIICTGACDTQVAANGGFLGETSVVDVNSGEPFTGFIKTTIGMLGVHASDVDGVVHETGVVPNIATVVIDEECPSADGPDLTATDPHECFWAADGPGNTAIVYVYTHVNGKLKAF